MSERKSKALNFIKKNVYYFVFIVSLAVLSVVTIALVVSSNNSGPVGGGNTIEKPDGNEGKDENSGSNENEDNEDNKEDDTTGGNKEEEQKPVVSVIIFDMPVNGTIIKEYVSAGVVYNQTLGLYSGHKAVDITAEEGALVKACYQGVIEEITTGKLEGTTVTIDHGNGLKSVYNSIEINEDLAVGQSVDKGESIGVISTNNRLEYKDGPHLHFEVLENGEKVDPFKYLLTEEK